MANTIRDYSATAASNTVVDGADISEGCSPAGINDAIRGVMADLKDVSTGAVALESPAADSLTVTGNVGAATFSGDGSALTGIPTPTLTSLGIANHDQVTVDASGNLDVTGTVTAENLQTTSAGRIFSGNGGNASSPMIANGSDQDTGIHFPAADTMALGTGGTNHLYLNSSGYVGVSNAVPEAALDVRGHTRLGNRRGSATDYSTELSSFGVPAGGSNRYGSYGMLGFYASSGYTGGARTFAITNAYAATKFAILYGNDSTTVPSIGTGGGVVDGGLALAIDGSGNVGINTGSPSGAKLHVAGGVKATDLISHDTTGINLQTSNGTKRLIVDNSGRVTMPYQPGFSVRQLAQSNIDCSSSDYIPFRHIHTTNFNTGNHFSSSTGRFTAPVAGNYIFGTTIRYDAFSGSYFYVTLLKNGSTFGARELTSLTGNYLHASVHTIMNMAAGDYVYVTLRNTGDSNIHIDHDCNFYGYLLG